MILSTKHKATKSFDGTVVPLTLKEHDALLDFKDYYYQACKLSPRCPLRYF